MSILEILGGVNTFGCELIINVSTTIHNCHLIEKYFVKIESNQIKQTVLKSKHVTIKRHNFFFFFLKKEMTKCESESGL